MRSKSSKCPSGFYAAVTSPGFDTFANGQAQIVAGVVSPEAIDAAGNWTNVVSVTINGVSTTLSSSEMGVARFLTFETH